MVNSRVEWHTLPEFVVVPPVVNKTIGEVPGHHKLKRSTGLVLIIYRVHLKIPETEDLVVQELKRAQKVYYFYLFIYYQKKW